MERLGLERKLKESERKVQMLASSRESILSQMTQLGQKCSAVKKQLDEATLQMESVEKSGKSTVSCLVVHVGPSQRSALQVNLARQLKGLSYCHHG